MGYKVCKFCENRERNTPLRGVYIPHFGQIWVKISIFGVLHPFRCTDGVKVGTEEGTKVAGNQFLLVVKATALKQQISIFYPQILSAEASFYIYDRPLTDTNIIASICVLNLQMKFLYLLF